MDVAGKRMVYSNQNLTQEIIKSAQNQISVWIWILFTIFITIKDNQRQLKLITNKKYADHATQTSQNKAETGIQCDLGERSQFYSARTGTRIETSELSHQKASLIVNMPHSDTNVMENRIRKELGEEWSSRINNIFIEFSRLGF